MFNNDYEKLVNFQSNFYIIVSRTFKNNLFIFCDAVISYFVRLTAYSKNKLELNFKKVELE